MDFRSLMMAETLSDICVFMNEAIQVVLRQTCFPIPMNLLQLQKVACEQFTW